MSHSPSQGVLRSPLQVSHLMIVFTFIADRTPIQKGEVSFRIPPDWTTPTVKADDPGEVSIAIDPDGPEARRVATVVTDIKKVSIGGSKEITVTVDELARTGTVVVTYKKGMVQRTAGEVEIKGYFKPGGGLPERASDIQDVTITNVADGSGTATIDRDSVDAGSNDNRIIIRYKADGSMDGGQVRLEIPGGWALDGLQGDDPDGDNYVKVQAESGGELREDSAIGTDRVVAYLGDFGYNNQVRFTFDNLQAQRSLGIANFTIYSAGTRGEDLIPVEGVAIPEGVDTELKKVAQRKVLDPGDEGRDGFLRIQVGGGGDGSGTVVVTTVGNSRRSGHLPR